MSILVDKSTRLVVQGITGSEGSFHTEQMIEYGTKVVAGVTPGRGGTKYLSDRILSGGVPIFNTVVEAVEKEGANTSVIFVPAAFAPDAIAEAADAGVRLIVCITEGIPIRDMIGVYDYLKKKNVRMVGPNCPGVISPGKAKVGIMPGFIHRQGSVGLISRSGTLTYEAVAQVTAKGYGQSTCVGIGGDPIIGTKFTDALRLFKDDDQTEVVVMIGEIGGTAEEEAADYVKKNLDKPVIGFIAGRTAPPGRRMGHAGAIISGGHGTADEKMAAMKKAGIIVVESPASIGDAVAKVLGRKSQSKRGVSVPKKLKNKPKARKPSATKRSKR